MDRYTLIFPLNDKGDVGIHIEWPSCKDITVTRKGMTSILVRGEKPAESTSKPYLNMRRVGKLEVEITVEKRQENLILDLKATKTDFVDGVRRMTMVHFSMLE